MHIYVHTNTHRKMTNLDAKRTLQISLPVRPSFKTVDSVYWQMIRIGQISPPPSILYWRGSDGGAWGQAEGGDLVPIY